MLQTVRMSKQSGKLTRLQRILSAETQAHCSQLPVFVAGNPVAERNHVSNWHRCLINTQAYLKNIYFLFNVHYKVDHALCEDLSRLPYKKKN